MSRIYNFSAGPAMLPAPVILKIREELLDWHGIGTSVMEISHRSDAFQALAAESEHDLRELLNIPDHYRVLFLQGGGRLQCAMVPMNLLGLHHQATYIHTGMWSQYAITEAKKYTAVHVAAAIQNWDCPAIPEQDTWDQLEDAAYCYYVDNETANGIEFPYIPDTSCPLVADMTSNLLSRHIDVSRFGLIFAAAQKNIGPAGLTIVIIREDLLERMVLPQTPTLLRYRVHAEHASLYHTPSTFSWYVASLVFKWLKQEGGIATIEARNRRKADKLYDYIDKSDFYQNTVDPIYRSRMNVTFSLKHPTYHETFLKQASQHGLLYLKGHRAVGGMRASIYNAMPEAAVDALIVFMEKFAADDVSHSFNPL